MKIEKTLLILKPDTIARGIVGEVLSRFERAGLKLVGMKFLLPDKSRLENHYARARRLGMMYIIWNRRMFRMYDTARGWAPYSGPSPHTDHVHFSLTRRGGAGSVRQLCVWPA